MKSVGFFVLWLVGSAVAVSVAFAGIAVVDDELINPPPAQVANLTNQGANGPAAADGPTSTGADPQTATATPTTPPTTANLSPTAPATEPTTAASAALPTTVDLTAVEPTAVPPTSVPPTAVPPTAVPPTSVAPTAVAPVPASTPVPLTPASPTPVPATPVPPTPVPAPTASALPDPQPQVVTFNLVGGSTAISFSASVVDVLWASPNPGFEVDIDTGSNVRVEFESDDHRSRLDASWSAGPLHEIREDDR